MNTFLLLDTETTGNTPADYLCQIAYVTKHDPHATVKINDIKEALFKPPVPISVESMAVHHITPKMVAGKPEFKWSAEHAEVKKLLDDGAIFVAHNAKFDVGMIHKEGLHPERVICTLRLARYPKLSVALIDKAMTRARMSIWLRLGSPPLNMFHRPPV